METSLIPDPKYTFLPDSILICENPAGNLLGDINNKTISGRSFVLVEKGSLDCTANGLYYSIKSRNVVLLPEPSCVSDIEVSDDFVGSLIVFSDAYMEKLHLNMDNKMAWSIVNKLAYEELGPADFESCKKYVFLMTDCMRSSENSYKDEIIWHVAKAFTYKIVSSFMKGMNEAEDGSYDRKNQIVKDFVKLIHRYGSKHRDLEFYANQMCISPKYLSHVVSKVTGKKSLKLIEDYTINKAMQLLKSTNLSVSQIASVLNFSASSDFCRYFRSRTGYSPKKFRVTKEVEPAG